jgi:hypothetical protein
MSNANEKQVGGIHYRTAYQHWDFVIKLNLDYFEATSTKYVSRWRKKNGVEDLQKGIHYLEKLMEVRDSYPPLQSNLSTPEIVEEIKIYAEANELTTLEIDFLLLICMGYLKEAHIRLMEIIEIAEEPGKLL